MKKDTQQINIKAPTELKIWAQQCADDNCQSLSGFIVKLLKDAKQKAENSPHSNFQNFEINNEKRGEMMAS